jgi:AraC-like DNA-binding protein
MIFCFKLYIFTYKTKFNLMNLYEFKPENSILLPFIHKYCVLESTIVTKLTDHWEMCMPDGFIKLYLNRDFPLYKNSKGEQINWKNGVGGHPTEDQFFIKLPNKTFRFLWVSIKPFFFNWISKVPIHEINNNITNLEDLFSKNDLDDLYRVLDEAGNENLVWLLDAFFLKMYEKNCRKNAALLHNQQSIYNNWGVLNFEKMAAAQNISLRTVQRNFQIHMGMSPKYYARIVRFNKVMKLRREKPNLNWHDIIYLCNYHDQSHFIHDIKSLTNKTPTAFFGNDIVLADLHIGR